MNSYLFSLFMAAKVKQLFVTDKHFIAFFSILSID